MVSGVSMTLYVCIHKHDKLHVLSLGLDYWCTQGQGHDITLPLEVLEGVC